MAACSTAATHMTLPVHTPVRQSIHQERTDSPANWCVHMQSHDSCSAVSTPHAARSAQCILLRNSESPLAPDTPPPPPAVPLQPPPPQTHTCCSAVSTPHDIYAYLCTTFKALSCLTHLLPPPHTTHTPSDVDIDKAVADTHFALFFNHVSETPPLPAWLALLACFW